MGEQEIMIWDIIQEPYVQLTFVICVLSVLTIWNWASSKKREEKRELERKKIKIGNAQIIGKREKQDDSFATEETPYGVIAVAADGIGGLPNGKLASALAVNAVIEEFKRQTTDIGSNPDYFFQTAANRANRAIINTFGDIKSGTTLVMAVIVHSVLYYAAVGDSSIALFRNGAFILITKKQNLASWMEKQYREGEISKEMALSVPAKRRLVEYVGHDGFPNIEMSDRPIFLKEGDKVLLYTDGVEALSQMEIEKILSDRAHPDDVAHNMMEAIAKKCNPYQDNATAILLEIS